MQRTLALLILGHILAAAPACREPSKESPPTVSTAPMDIHFQAEAQATATELVVDYSVKNDSAADIVLFNRIATQDADRKVVYLPGSVYVDLDGDTLRISRVALTIPAGMNLNKHEVPELTRIPPKQTFTERFTVALPARVHNPIRRAIFRQRSFLEQKDPRQIGGPLTAADPKEFSKVTFVIGYARVDAGEQLTPVSAAYPDVLRMSPYPMHKQQTWEKTFNLPNPLPALDYKPSPAP
jgi:hypothetical protein